MQRVPASWLVNVLVVLGLLALAYSATLPSITIWITFQNDSDKEVKVLIVCPAEDSLRIARIPARSERRVKVYTGDDSEQFNASSFVIIVTDEQGQFIDSFTRSGEQLALSGTVTVGHRR